jgi:integrase
MHTHYQDGTVYETGKRVKKWAGRIRVYEDGKTKRPNIILGLKSEMTRRQAEAKPRAMIRESGGTPAPVLKPLTFGAYWKDHYIPLRSIRWSQPTRAGYEGYMQSLILPIFEHVFLKDIDHLRLANFFEQLRSRCGYWAMQRIRILMKAILEEALQDDLIGKNPMRRLKMPKTEEPDQPYLAKPEIASVLKHMAGNQTRHGIRDYAIARIGTFCAVRSAEVFGLRWESYLGDRFLIQDSAWEGKLFENTTKKGRRHVGIDAKTKRILEQWKAICPDARPEALMFPILR